MYHGFHKVMIAQRILEISTLAPASDWIVKFVLCRLLLNEFLDHFFSSPLSAALPLDNIPLNVDSFIEKMWFINLKKLTITLKKNHYDLPRIRTRIPKQSHKGSSIENVRSGRKLTFWTLPCPNSSVWNPPPPGAYNESPEVFDIIKPGRRVKIKGYRQ